jgi:hypothetical protein
LITDLTSGSDDPVSQLQREGVAGSDSEDIPDPLLKKHSLMKSGVKFTTLSESKDTL